MDPPLLGGHLGERCLDHRLAALLPGRIQHVDFPDPAEFVEQRPNRSFPRLSRKPASKWRSSKATATATTA